MKKEKLGRLKMKVIYQHQSRDRLHIISSLCVQLGNTNDFSDNIVYTTDDGWDGLATAYVYDDGTIVVEPEMKLDKNTFLRSIGAVYCEDYKNILDKNDDSSGEIEMEEYL